jgi:hypothetical protein
MPDAIATMLRARKEALNPNLMKSWYLPALLDYRYAIECSTDELGKLF